jgi:hypothetical protein
MACSGYWCGVNMWHTLSTIIPLSTCIFRQYWLVVAQKFLVAKKKVAIICIVFDLVSSWIVVENTVAKGGGFLLVIVGNDANLGNQAIYLVCWIL